MAKFYLFKDIKYTSLNDLANAYIENYSDAIDDIYQNSKKLIRFTKALNKNIYKNVIEYLTYSKYMNNALTFIIFDFLIEKKVIINGKEYSFKQFIEALKEAADVTPNIYMSFIRDFGISKTFATMNIEKTLSVDSYYIEKNIDDPFVYKYLTTYYDFDIIESLHGRLTTISTYGEECFRRASKFCKKEEFKLALAHKYGFKEAYLAHKEINPLFYSIKLLKKEINEDELSKLITGTFYWWLLDNFDKYTYINSAKNIYNRLLAVKKEYDGYIKKINARKIDGIAFDQMNEFSRTLYLIYLDFINEYKNSNIAISKKIDPTNFILDKKYCNTYICIDFMKGKVIKLHQDNTNTDEEIEIDNENADQNSQLNEIDDILSDVDDEEEISSSGEEYSGYSDKSIKKQEKIINKFRTFGRNAIFGAFFTLVVVVLLFVLSTIFEDEQDSFIGDLVFALDGTANLTTLVVCIITVLAILALSICLYVMAAQIEKKYNSYLKLKSLGKVERISAKQDIEIQKIKSNEAKLAKASMKTKRVFTAVLYALLSLANTIFAIYVVAAITAFAPDLVDWKSAYGDNKVLFYIIGPAIALVLGLLKKKKGFLFAFLNLLISFGIVFGLAFIL